MPTFARPYLLFVLIFMAASAGVAADIPQELAALRAKAAAGDAIAEYNLGLAYVQGRDIPSDLLEAFVWLSLAREHGSTGRALESVLGQMSPEQIAEGKKRLSARRNARSSAQALPPALAPVPPVDLGALQNELKGLLAANQQLTGDLARSRVESTRFKAEAARAVGGLEAIKTESAADLAKNADEIRSLKELVSRLEATARTQTPKEESAVLEARLKLALTANTELVAKRAELESNLTRATRAADEAAALNKTLSTEIAHERALRSEEAEKLALARSAEQSSQKARLEAKKLEEEIRSISLQKETAERSLTAVRAELDALAVRAKQAEATLVLKAGAEARLTELGGQLEEARRDLGTARRDLTIQIKQNETATRSKLELDTRVLDLAGKLDAAQRALAVAQRELEAQIDRNKASVVAKSEAEARMTELTGQLQAALGNLAERRPEMTVSKVAPAALAERPSNSKIVETEGKFDDNGRGYALVRRERIDPALPPNDSGGELVGLRQRVTSLETERAELKKQLAALETTPASTFASGAENKEKADLKKQATDLETKLSVTLRSYTLIQEENARLIAESQLVGQRKATEAAASLAKLEAQNGELREHARQIQGQLSEAILKNTQLLTRIATAGPAPGSRYAAPTRPANGISEAYTPSDQEQFPAPEPQPAAAVASGPRSHMVQPGESLSRISRRYYGTASRWNEIFDANRNILNQKNNITIGAVLVIPR